VQKTIRGLAANEAAYEYLVVLQLELLFKCIGHSVFINSRLNSMKLIRVLQALKHVPSVFQQLFIGMITGAIIVDVKGIVARD
jgi:hypothetical protein